MHSFRVPKLQKLAFSIVAAGGRQTKSIENDQANPLLESAG